MHEERILISDGEVGGRFEDFRSHRADGSNAVGDAGQTGCLHRGEYLEPLPGRQLNGGERVEGEIERLRFTGRQVDESRRSDRVALRIRETECRDAVVVRCSAGDEAQGFAVSQRLRRDDRCRYVRAEGHQRAVGCAGP